MLFCLKLWPINFSYPSVDLTYDSYCCCVCLMMPFYSHFLYIISWNCCVRKSCPLLSMDSWKFIFFCGIKSNVTGDITLPTKVRPSSQGYGFSSGHVWMWKLDCEGIWVLKNWCFWTVVLEKTLESPLDCKEIQPVHPKGYQSWVFIGRTDVEAETLILWPPHVKSWLIGKDPDAGNYWGQKEKGTTEDEMAGWYHWLDGHEFG